MRDINSLSAIGHGQAGGGRGQENLPHSNIEGGRGQDIARQQRAGLHTTHGIGIGTSLNAGVDGLHPEHTQKEDGSGHKFHFFHTCFWSVLVSTTALCQLDGVQGTLGGR